MIRLSQNVRFVRVILYHGNKNMRSGTTCPACFILAVPDITAGGVTAGNHFLQGGERIVMQERVQMIDYA